MNDFKYIAKYYNLTYRKYDDDDDFSIEGYLIFSPTWDLYNKNLLISLLDNIHWVLTHK